jgi:hypothetical protein
MGMKRRKNPRSRFASLHEPFLAARVQKAMTIKHGAALTQPLTDDVIVDERTSPTGNASSAR